MSRPVVATLRLLVACINIPTKVGPKAWARCFALVVARAHIFGINEAGSWRAKRLYIRLARELGLTHYGLSGSNPVFWDPDLFRKLRARQVKLHARAKGRLARRWPGFNAARYLTEVVLRHIQSRVIVAVLNVHLVAPGRKVNSRWRARMRKRSLDRIRRMVAHHILMGRIVVLLGDTNIADEIDVRGMLWLFPSGVDKIGVGIPEGMDLEGFDLDQFLAPTDHKKGRAAAVDIEIGA